MLNFFSCRRKNILCWAFLIVEVMFSAHLRSYAIIVPRNLKDFTVLTGESHMMRGMVGAGLLPSLLFYRRSAPGDSGCTRKPGCQLLFCKAASSPLEISPMRVVSSANVRSLTEGWLEVQLLV